jgi:CheY-like chemotaxis protein
MEKKVLILDDEALVLKTLEQLFRSHGYSPHCTMHGADVLELMQEHSIRVAFTDLRMPRMDGLEFCKRAIQLDPSAYVYAISGFIDAYTPDQYRDAGFTGRFRKPFNIDLLLGACREAFEKIKQQSRDDDASSDSELRKHSRVRTREIVQITIMRCNTDATLVGKTFDCATGDISAGGMQIRVDDSIPEGTVLGLHVGWSGSDVTYVLRGKVKWAAETQAGTGFNIGLALFASSRDLHQWVELVKKLESQKV